MEIATGDTAEGDVCAELIEILAIAAESGEFAVVRVASGV